MSTAMEIQAIRNRYARRAAIRLDRRYSPLDPYVLRVEQEKERAIVALLASAHISQNIWQRTLLEIGCGGGGNLARFLRLGFVPHHLVGNDLLEDRLRDARSLLPTSVPLLLGDATQLDLPAESFDIVCLFTVLSSILDDATQELLAARAWSFVKPGGGILFYDFIWNNPSNPDVQGVTRKRLGQLFPTAEFRLRRITLAPPIGRRAVRCWPGCYALLSSLWPLRTHLIGWISKPLASNR